MVFELFNILYDKYPDIINGFYNYLGLNSGYTKTQRIYSSKESIIEHFEKLFHPITEIRIEYI